MIFKDWSKMELLGNNGEFVTIQFRSFFYKKTTAYMFEISKVNIFLKKFTLSSK